jgi:hypothetical protein
MTQTYMLVRIYTCENTRMFIYMCVLYMCISITHAGSQRQRQLERPLGSAEKSNGVPPARRQCKVQQHAYKPQVMLVYIRSCVCLCVCMYAYVRVHTSMLLHIYHHNDYTTHHHCTTAQYTNNYSTCTHTETGTRYSPAQATNACGWGLHLRSATREATALRVDCAGFLTETRAAE